MCESFTHRPCTERSRRFAGGCGRFDELTASERRIAEFAAAGRTNREIAAELFITPKTVENHLTRVYGKLGIGSRRELTGALWRPLNRTPHQIQGVDPP